MTEAGQLMPINVVEQARISPQQQSDLVNNVARMYLRSLKVPMSEDMLRRALGVLGDAMLRGMADQGKVALAPTDKIRPIIDKGLTLREDLRSRATKLLGINLANQTTYADLVGPLALPVTLLQACQAQVSPESKRFALTADISTTQQLVQLGETRLALTNLLAQRGLEELAQNGLNVSLDQIPETANRAKLIRNMITSSMLRGNLSPLITTSDLRQFVMLQAQASSFSPESAQQLIATLAPADEESIKFISDLFVQTAESFRSHQLIPDDGDSISIDRFYRQFARDLLLLHPALEEEQLTVNPLKVGDVSKSVWSEGTRIGQVLIPSAEQLARAVRQTIARGDKLTANRLQGGIKTLNWFRETVVAHSIKVAATEDTLAQRQLLLLALRDKSHPLPNEAYIETSDTLWPKSRKITAEHYADRLKRVVDDSVVHQRDAEEYEAALNAQYGENWPWVVPMSRQAFIDNLLQDERSIHGKKAGGTMRLGRIEFLLHIDYFWDKENIGLLYGFLRDDNEGNWCRNMIAITKQQEIRVTEEDLTKIKEHLAQYFRPNYPKNQIPKINKHYADFWDNTYRQLQLLQNPTVDRNLALATIGHQIKEARIALLQTAQEVLKTRQEIDKAAKAAQSITREFLEDPFKPLPETATWSAEMATRYIEAMKRMTLPSINKPVIPEFEEHISEMQELLAKMPKSDLPIFIPTKEEFKKWLEDAMEKAGLETETLNPKQRHYHITRNRLQRHSTLYKLLDSPLLPLPQEGEMRSDQFRELWKRTVNLAYANYNQEEAEEDRTVKTDEYESAIRASFRYRLLNELRYRREALKKLKMRNLEEELAERMNRAGLMLPVPPESN